MVGWRLRAPDGSRQTPLAPNGRLSINSSLRSEARMTQMRRWWFVGGSALMLAACTEPNAPAPAVKLAFIVQPSNATAGVAISPVVAVAIEEWAATTQKP